MFRLLVFVGVMIFTVKSIAEDFLVGYVEHPHIQPYIHLVQQAYADIGVDTTFVRIPVGRRFKALDKGEIDADVSALKHEILGYENIVRVELPLSQINVFLACLKLFPCESNAIFDEQQVLYIDSALIKLLELELSFRPHKRVMSLERIDAHLELLKRGRINYLVLSGDVKQTFSAVELRDINFVKLTQTNIYHHINKRHEKRLSIIKGALEDNLSNIQ